MRSHCKLFILLLLVFSFGRIFAARLVPVEAPRGMVVTVCASASRIGVQIMKSGGNAVDAAVAVGFALAVVDPQAGRPHWAPNDVMLNYFDRMLEDPTAEDARYVLALLLVRRRVLRVEGHEKDAQGREVIVLHCGRNEAQYRVAEVMPTPERAAAIQQQLSELLQTHGS